MEEEEEKSADPVFTGTNVIDRYFTKLYYVGETQLYTEVLQ